MKINDISREIIIHTPRLLSFSFFDLQNKATQPQTNGGRHKTMASLPPYALEVSPESSLQFSITQHPQGDGDENNASKCIMTLRHTGATKESLAFKVSLLVIIVMYTSGNGR